jgi:hypothetical protein
MHNLDSKYHDNGTKENEQVERIHSDLLSALEILREASREEFVEQLKKTCYRRVNSAIPSIKITFLST